MSDSRLSRLADAVVELGGVPDGSFQELTSDPPDPAALHIVIEGLVQSGVGGLARLGLAELALVLVADDRRFRPAVETAVRGADLGLSATVYKRSMRLRGDDLRWWYSVFAREIRDDDMHSLMLEEYGTDLIDLCADDVVRYLLEPPRPPGGAMVAAVATLLISLREHDGLERRWVEWIEAGVFDWGAPGAVHVSGLARCLQDLCTAQVPAGRRLVDSVVARWQRIATGQDEIARRRIVRTLHSLTTDYYTASLSQEVLEAALAAVVPSAHTARLPEAAALDDAVRDALVLPRRSGRFRSVEDGNQTLYEIMIDTERRTPSLPWAVP